MLARKFRMYAPLLIAIAVGRAGAQEPTETPFGGSRRPDGEQLLLYRSVQDELNMSPAQRGQVKAVEDRYRVDVQASARFARAGDRERSRAALAEAREQGLRSLARLASALAPPQAARLKQVDLQLAGLNALGRPEVYEALRLTEDQKGRIEAVAEDYAKELTEAFGTYQEVMRQARVVEKAAVEKAVATFTAPQKQTWQALTGAPFELKEDAPRFPGVLPVRLEGPEPGRVQAKEGAPASTPVAATRPRAFAVDPALARNRRDARGASVKVGRISLDSTITPPPGR